MSHGGEHESAAKEAAKEEDLAECAERQRVDHEHVEAGAKGVDYGRLVKEFGSSLLRASDLARISAMSGEPPHLFLRRELFFSHRDLVELLVARHTRGEPFYIFTGRGPSASMHLGHLVPFMFAAYLQRVFHAPVVIQLSDDEKFFFKCLSLEQAGAFAAENIVDIIACGFDPDRTFIFKDTDAIGALYPMVCQIQRRLTVGQLAKAFGVRVHSEGGEATDPLGKLMYPAVQMAPAFAAGLPAQLFGGASPRCLVPMGIDQDPYFRVVRDIAGGLGQPKPAVVHNKFLPSLAGLHAKMAATGPSGGAIHLTDTPKQVRKKMNSAFSGARGDGSLADHRRLGADLETDVPIKYLQYFLEDDAELATIEAGYAAGELTCGEVKQRAAAVVNEVLARHQQARARVTAEDVARFTAVRPLL
mmetsp:Transcript_8844/g.23436  ORF Transcript_8844/g.23436 Transcript_8844/m.23436 type:complete len:417 (-) Transcript_8844:231-1481(-)